MLVGLSSTVVERLKSDSWGENLQSESYNQMKTLVSPMSNFSAYRTWYSKEPNLPAIPQLGIHLSDLLHLSDAVKAQTGKHPALTVPPHPHLHSSSPVPSMGASSCDGSNITRVVSFFFYSVRS